MIEHKAKHDRSKLYCINMPSMKQLQLHLFIGLLKVAIKKIKIIHNY